MKQGLGLRDPWGSAGYTSAERPTDWRGEGKRCP